MQQEKNHQVMEITTSKKIVKELSESVTDDLFCMIDSLRINKNKKEELVRLIIRCVYLKFAFEFSKEMTEEVFPIRELDDKLESVFGNDISFIRVV